MSLRKYGRLTAIYGPMFSGKTDELLRRIRRAKIAKKIVQVFKPQKDDRYSQNRILPHYMASREDENAGEAALAVINTIEIEKALRKDVNLVGIEEAQFFDESLFHLIRKINANGIDVVISFLDQDFRRMPFVIPDSERTVGEYLAICHESIKLEAICVVCGKLAQHTQKMVLLREYPNGQPIYAPASYYDEIVAVGTNLENSKIISQTSKHPLYVYEARCLDHHQIPDDPLLQDLEIGQIMTLF